MDSEPEVDPEYFEQVHTNLGDDYVMALGEIALFAASVEHWMLEFALLNPRTPHTPGQRSSLEGQTFRQLGNAARDSIARSGNPEWIAKFEAVHLRATAVMRDRNDCVHAAWMATTNPREAVRRVRNRRVDERRRVSLSAVRGIVVELVRVSEDLFLLYLEVIGTLRMAGEIGAATPPPTTEALPKV